MNRFNSPGIVQRKRKSALERRKKDVTIYSNVLADKDAPEVERVEAQRKREIAMFEVAQLEAKINGISTG